jgi:hypothetical protein
LHEASDNHESTYRWSLVKGIAETPDHIFIMLDRNAGLIIPRASFPTPGSCGEFLAKLREYAS